MTQQYKAYYQSALGLIEIVATDQAVKSLYFIEPDARDATAESANGSPALTECVRQLDDYFAGELSEFELALDPDGTDFQKAVWQQLTTIPFGKTVAYLDIARGLGNEKAVRAVGAANGQNPISIIIPCHRVIGSDGSLTGYGGGLWRKAWLLKHEGVLREEQLPLF
ncbi:MAG: methylated-DNA--[protein]-cysteine S-methyltransferase [Anaerolineae bacterium]|nr:methylated-DNA--[protein]-cysteine S-methyltransferase [Anaerolineae bacterium]